VFKCNGDGVKLDVEDNVANKVLRNKLLELAAMLKEKKEGAMKDLVKIKAKFSLQEGIVPEKVNRYIEQLKQAGLLMFYSGGRRWKYCPEEEWDGFTVIIE